ncbi:TPA: hypothetical protein OBQ04_005393, partial [Escherichia coli]|nr:hypothetical protein [Escherichia coli]
STTFIATACAIGVIAGTGPDNKTRNCILAFSRFNIPLIFLMNDSPVPEGLISVGTNEQPDMLPVIPSQQRISMLRFRLADSHALPVHRNALL